MTTQKTKRKKGMAAPGGDKPTSAALPSSLSGQGIPEAISDAYLRFRRELLMGAKAKDTSPSMHP